MKRFRMATTLMCLTAVCVATPLCAYEWTGNVNMLLGIKNMDKDDWKPVEAHGELGLTFDIRHESWPVALALGISISGAEETWNTRDNQSLAKLEAATAEFYIGARKIIDAMDFLRPYFGGGITAISAAAKQTILGVSADDSGGGMGFYVEGGVYVTFAYRFNVGLDLKYSRAQVSLFNRDVEAGGGHAALFAGIHW